MTPLQTAPATHAVPATIAMPAATDRPRLDLYASIHKALRRAMADTLAQLGAMDVHDERERQQALSAVDALLTLLRGHLKHENDFVHTAIEARRPGAARQTAAEHAEHLEAIGNLEDEVQALRTADAARRESLVLPLYRRLALFIGENLMHMHVEERDLNAALWALYSDAELAEIHDRLVASVPPDEMAQVLRWMAPSLTVAELTMLFTDMRSKAPAQAFDAMLGVVRSQLIQPRWLQLARALGVAPVPGLVEC